jgi:molybdopterin-containing oxidoreductase family membrane subunit
MYNAYFVLLMVALWLALRADFARVQTQPGLKGRVARLLAFSKQPLTPRQEQNGKDWLKVLGGFGIVLAIAFPGGVGSLFGTISAQPYWHTPLMPILFLTGAAVSGVAFMLFVVAAFSPERDEKYMAALRLLGKVVIGLLVIDLVLEWAEFSIPMWYGIGGEYDLMMEILFGQYWYVFWIFHIGLGCVVPLVLLLGTKNKPWAYALAGFLVASMFLAVRLNLVIPALVDPNLIELELAFQDARLTFSYLPSLFEWQVTAGVIAIGIVLFYVGNKLLPLMIRERASA